MKNIQKLTWLLIGGALLTLSACKKEETRAILNPAGPLTLSATVNTLVLAQANADNTAVGFSWTKGNFGFDAGVNYTLELCKGGTNFATATSTSINMNTLLAKTYTVKDFNAKMQDIIANGVASAVQARVKADVGSGVAPIYSNVLSMTVTAYRDIVNYSFPQALFIAGNYQGWSPSTAPKIVDKFASGTTGSNYDGYIYFNNAAPEFKMVKGPDWSFGDFGNYGGSNLGPGGANLTLSNGAGVYRITANTSNMTWSNTKINTWGIIGSATPGGWGASTAMTYDIAGNFWIITTNLSAGELKFRANNDWGTNFGDNNPADGKPEYGGDNIAIPTAGNYTITLDLGIAGNFAYSIRRN
ncbi:MAG: SusE domain-containing protein [Bacteroidota bacterium]